MTSYLISWMYIRPSGLIFRWALTVYSFFSYILRGTYIIKLFQMYIEGANTIDSLFKGGI